MYYDNSMSVKERARKKKEREREWRREFTCILQMVIMNDFYYYKLLL